jgi:predicted DCC family thiol-disulfide oxidoreductase YuxK
MNTTEHPVVLFDGVCNLCNNSVQFLIQRDPKAHLRFTSLQSETGQRLQTEHGIDSQSLDSMLLVEGGRLYRESDATLRMARHLKGAWPLLGAFRIIPRPLRNLVYRWIARNRYRWFGKTEACWLPTPELRARFLE